MTAPIFLLDGPLRPGTPPSRRQRVTSDMAHDLLALDAFRRRDEAIRMLDATHKYRTFDLFVPGMVEDAMQLAAQEIVYKEMMEP